MCTASVAGRDPLSVKSALVWLAAERSSVSVPVLSESDLSRVRDLVAFMETLGVLREALVREIPDTLIGNSPAMRRIYELVAEHSQFVIATHSPILLGYPEADIWQASKFGLERVALLAPGQSILVHAGAGVLLHQLKRIHHHQRQIRQAVLADDHDAGDLVGERRAHQHRRCERHRRADHRLAEIPPMQRHRFC